jgi:hypothetical protein
MQLITLREFVFILRSMQGLQVSAESVFMLRSMQGLHAGWCRLMLWESVLMLRNKNKNKNKNVYYPSPLIHNLQWVQVDAKESALMLRSMQGLQVDAKGICFHAEEYAGAAG